LTPCKQTNQEIRDTSQFYSRGHSAGSHSTSVHSATVTQVEAPADPGLNAFKKDILIQLGISPQLTDKDRGLRHAYEKYRAYLQACKTYDEKIANKTWVGSKLTGADLIQLFISKSYFHSHYKKYFSKISHYPDMMDWLEGGPNAPSDEDIWGEMKGSYNFKDLEAFIEGQEKKKKRRGRGGKDGKDGKDDKIEGGSKKAGDKKKKKKQVN
jgi:hypothetical protein